MTMDSRGEGRLIRRRMRYERAFTQVLNSWVRDEMISYRARGVLVLLLSHEHGFKVTLKAIAAASPNEGIDAIRTAVLELESAGYLRRHPVRTGGQYQGDDWEICDPHDQGATALPALDDPMRQARTALDDPTRTALDDPTLKNTSRRRTSEPRSRGLALVDARETSAQRCRRGIHDFTTGDYCQWCAARDPLLVTVATS